MQNDIEFWSVQMSSVTVYFHLLLSVLISTDGSTLYHAFLLREFSNENLEFWLAVDEYKHLKPQNMEAKAQNIYNEFVADNAPKQVSFWKSPLFFLPFLYTFTVPPSLFTERLSECFPSICLLFYRSTWMPRRDLPYWRTSNQRLMTSTRLIALKGELNTWWNAILISVFSSRDYS